jgi:hypothetical protein
VDKIEKHFQTHGFELFAAELRASRSFIGYIGLAIPSFQARFTPSVEVGWRLSAIHCGEGLATEAAREVMREKVDASFPRTVGFSLDGPIHRGMRSNKNRMRFGAATTLSSVTAYFEQNFRAQATG